MERHYNSAAAEAAQQDYADTHGSKLYAPHDGICRGCKRDIYAIYRGKGSTVCGYSVEYAESHLITRCPFCSASFKEGA